MAKKKTVPAKQKPLLSERSAWLIVAAAIAFVAVIRIRLLQIPLERDEGEFAYMGQLMLQGHAPYSLAYNMKLPGIYAAYALIMAVFGQTIGGIHFGFLLVNAAAIVMVFLLGRRLFDPIAGAVAAAAYAILTIQPGVFGASAHATHFVVLFALAGILLLLRAFESDRTATLAWSGLLFGVAFLMKQPGLLFVIFAAVYLCWTDLRVRSLSLRQSLQRLGMFALFVALPYGITCLLLWRAGVFPRFWFWTYDYARVYGTLGTPVMGWHVMCAVLRRVAPPVLLIWVLALGGFASFAWDAGSRKRARFVSGLFAASFAALSCGLAFREHYFILIYPAISLLVGLSVSSCTRLLSGKLRLVPAVIFLAAIVIPMAQQREFFFEASPNRACRMLYRVNPFPEAVEVAKAVRLLAPPGDVVGILGSEPEICFYANRHSATGYVYMYSLNEMQPYAAAMRKDMENQLLRARPRIIVVMAQNVSWECSFRIDHSRPVWNWMVRSLIKDYDVIGRVWVDPDDPDNRTYSWNHQTGDDATSTVVVLQRKGSVER